MRQGGYLGVMMPSQQQTERERDGYTNCFISHRSERGREMDSLKFFWHFNVMNPYTHLITLLHVMRRHTWTATRTEMIVLKMTSIIPPSACMTDERDKKKNCTIRVREGTRHCLVNHLPISPFCVFKVFPQNVCVCVEEWELESVPGLYWSCKRISILFPLWSLNRTKVQYKKIGCSSSSHKSNL